MKKGILLLLMSLVVLSLVAGPFGIKDGAKKEEIDIVSEEDGIIIINVPKPHSMFTTYIAKFDQNDKIIRIVAGSEPTTLSVYGTEIKRKYQIVKESLEKKYNESESYNYLKQGSIWNEPKDFSIALFKREYIIYSFWDFDQGEIVSIWLRIAMLNRNDGMIVLTYDLKGSKEFSEEKNTEDESRL